MASTAERLQESECYFLNTIWTVPMVESPLSSRGQDFPSCVNMLSEGSCVLDHHCGLHKWGRLGFMHPAKP